MYETETGVVNTAAGVAVLPSTGDNTIVFAVALGLLASGIIILIAAAVKARKESSKAN